MSNPSPPLAPVPPPMAAAEEEDALEKGELRFRVPVQAGYESSDSDTEDDDDGRRYLFQPRAEYDDYASEAARRRPQPHHRSPRRRPRRLTPLDVLFLGPGAGAALPSPTPSSGECESDATLSDDDDHGRGSGNPSAGPWSAAADAVGRGWAATTGKRGWKAGDNNNFVSLAKRPAAVVSDLILNTISAGGDGQAGTSTTSAQAAPAAHHHHDQPPLPKQEAQPPPRGPQPPRQKRERATEYTCKECGKSYPTNQALGGHAAGHRNKQREAAAAMAAAAVAGGDASIAAAFLPLRGRFGKADEAHECRQCGKVFGSGVALGGHMRVHYTGPPIVPARKNKKRCLAPLPPAPIAGGDIAVAAAPPVGLSLALSIKTEQEPPAPPAAVPAGAAVRVVRLFGFDIDPVEAPAPLQQQQQGSGGTTEDSSATGQQQH